MVWALELMSYTPSESLHCVGLYSCNTLYQSSDPANWNDRKLGVFNMKLKEGTPLKIVIFISFKTKDNKIL